LTPWLCHPAMRTADGYASDAVEYSAEGDPKWKAGRKNSR
jgi:hypothetical protein